ncbi:hypothetical protein BRE01_47530 [Brevibacillus reuszeri]|uniref:DUF4097 domain-containing protein n=1 Tax=Brevibacillus reuszeri TaxID=54915 RepID=A0A0K9YYS0_9BACL|nr:DUF4097 family beta strand repeat-containing protein [Brevibacillus reuszeri]KNB73878.1 hypothetical protein ADS79_08085 [Brevibacillus reuszeri]MED1859975.1 DUF4097 family beta strand repeat-containing protein [Brevibacillus reuszeri]GED71051.1 hypothetical protein BRE01_47530 [Brevibacillus reuszeri]
MKHWGKKIFGISLLLFLLGASGLVWMFTKQDYFSFSLAQVNEERTIQEAFTSVDVATGTVDVVITPSSLPTASVRLVGEASDQQMERMQFASKVLPDGTLKVDVNEKLHVNLFFPVSGRLQLELYLPEKDYEKLALNTATGDIKASKLSVKKTNIVSSTGDVELDGLSGESLDIQTDTGDMKLSGIRSAVQIQTTTGEIDSLLLPELVHNVSIESETGDIRIKVDQEPAAANLDLSTETGSIKTSWKTLSYELKSEKKVTGSIGTGGPTVNVRTTTGDIRIQ